MKKRRFKIGGQTYEIPENEVSAFLSDNPGAVEVAFYEVKGSKYDIPIKEAAQFEKEMGVKKKETANRFSAIFDAVGTVVLDENISLPFSEGAADISGLIVPTTSKKSDPNKSNLLQFAPFVKVGETVVDIHPQFLPEGYTKDNAGAEKYSLDLQARIAAAQQNQDQESFDIAIKEAAKMSALGQLNNNKATVSVDDLQEINSLVFGKEQAGGYTEPSPVMLDVLKLKKQEVLNNAIASFRKKYPNVSGVSIKNGRIEGYVPKGNRGQDLVSVSAPSVSNYDGYIEKVGNAIQKEISGEQLVRVEEADTRSALSKYINAIPDLVVGGKSRTRKETINNSFLTGLESLKYSDENKYDKLISRIEKGKTLASVEVADLTKKGADIINARELEKLERGETDVDSYAAKSGQIGEQLDFNFYSRPDVLQRAVATVIGDHYAGDGGVVIGKWFVSDKEIDGVPKQKFIDAGIDPDRPEVKSVIETIKKNEGILPFDNAIQKDDLLREFRKGVWQPIEGTGNWLTGLVKSDNQRVIENRLEPLRDYSSKRTDYFDKHYGLLGDAFSGAGQFISQVALMKGAGRGINALGRALGGSDDVLRVLAPGQAAPTLFREGTRIGNMVMDKSQVFGRLAVPFIQSYDANYKAALDRTDNPLAAKAMAFTNSAVESLSEQIFDNVKFGNQILRDLRGVNWNSVTRAFNRGAWDDVAQGQFRDALQNSIKSSIKKVAKAGAGAAIGLTKEAFEEVPVQLSDFVTSALANPDNVTNRELLPELVDSFKAGLVSFSIPSLIGAGTSARRMLKNNTTQADALMLAAGNRDSVLESIQSLLEDGELSQDEANEKIQLLNTAARSLQELPKRYSNGNPLTEADRVRYMALTINEKYLKEEMNDAADDAIKSVNQGLLSDITKQKEQLLTKSDNPNTAPSEPSISPAIVALSSEPDQEQISDAANFVQELRDNSLISDIEYQQAIKDPLSYFREVAQQANNIMEDGTFDTAYDSRQAAIDRFTQPVVDYANELFPDFKELADQSEVTESTSNTQTELTEAQRNRISEIESKQQQLFDRGYAKKTAELDRLIASGMDEAQANEQASEYFSQLPERNEFEQLESIKNGILASIQTADDTAVEETLEEEAVPEETVREKYNAGRLASTEEPPPAKGRAVVTLSGLTEEERKQRISEREKSAKSSISRVGDELLSKIDQYNSLPKGRAGKLKPEGIQLLNSIRNEAATSGFTFDSSSGRLKTKKGKIIKRPSADARSMSIKEDAVVLRDRSDRTNEIFGQFLDAGIFPNGYDLSNKQMSDVSINGAIEDILDGIPSIRANNYLNQLDASIEADSFEIGEGDQKRTVSLNELLNISTETIGEPLTEESISQWLSEDAELTPAQEQNVIDNIENLIEVYEDQQVDDTAEVESTEAGSETESSASSEQDTPSPPTQTAPERPRVNTAQSIADELRSILGGNDALALDVNPSDRVTFEDIGITGQDTINTALEKLIAYGGPLTDVFTSVLNDTNLGAVRLQLVNNTSGLTSGESGLYYPMGGENGGLLQVSNKGNSYYTFAHELMHFLTLDSAVAQQTKDSAAYKAIEDLYNYIASKKGRPVVGTATFENYALSNVKEFMAELLINLEFRNYVSDVFAENKSDIEASSRQIKDAKINSIGDLIFNFFKDLFNKLIGKGATTVDIDEKLPVVENAARIATELFFGKNANNVSGISTPNNIPNATDPLALPDLDRNKKISDFVRKKLSQGVDKSVIKDGLLLAGLSEQDADSFINTASETPQSNAKTTSDEANIISAALSREISAEEFPTIFSDNPTAKQLTAQTQGEGQQREVNGSYVVALESDLRDASMQTAALLESQLGGDWGLKTLSWIEQNPSQGNLAQVVGVLNVISTDIFQSINSTTDSQQLGRLKDIQNRIDVVSNQRARTASLTLRQRILYSKFAQGEKVTDALAQMILSPEQIELIDEVNANMATPVTDEQINSSPDLQTTRNTPKERTKKGSNKGTVSDLVNKGVEASTQRDASGTEVRSTFQDKIKQARDKMNNLNC